MLIILKKSNLINLMHQMQISSSEIFLMYEIIYLKLPEINDTYERVRNAITLRLFSHLLFHFILQIIFVEEKLKKGKCIEKK